MAKKVKKKKSERGPYEEKLAVNSSFLKIMQTSAKHANSKKGEKKP